MDGPDWHLVRYETTHTNEAIVTIARDWPEVAPTPARKVWGIRYAAQPGRPARTETQRFIGRGTNWKTFPEFRPVGVRWEALLYSLEQRHKFFNHPEAKKYLAAEGER